MRREYVEDLVLVVGGGALIAGAWIVYWPAGLMVAGLVMILLGVLAYKHHGVHKPAESHAHRVGHEETPPPMSAAAWRFHHPSSRLSANGSSARPGREGSATHP